MNRKNTILLAVLINAGLLVVLFVTAMTSQEEITIAPTHEISGSSRKMEPTPPLFADELDLTLRAAQKVLAADPLPQVLPEKSAETPIAHALPPLAAPVAPESIPVVEKPVIAAASSAMLEVAVKKGDTLEKIAKVHHTTVDEIIKLNRLPSSFLRVGQLLKLPAEKAAKAAVKVAEKPVEGPDYYTVKVGDNPWTIAMKHHLKVEELLKLNGLNDEKARKLKPGDRLRIR